MEKYEKLPEGAENLVDPTELSDAELEETSGGIILVGGKYVQLKSTILNSLIGRVSLNPQPLPPKELYHR